MCTDTVSPLAHEPTRPALTLFENIYLRAWQDAQREKYKDFPSLLDYLVNKTTNVRYFVCIPVTQRHATVAASFFRYLGTGNGQSLVFRFIAAADILGIDEKLSQRKALSEFLLADSVAEQTHDDNMLHSVILATEEDYLKASNRTPSKLRTRVISNDIRLLQVCARWLGTEDGNSFLVRCEELCKKERESST